MILLNKPVGLTPLQAILSLKKQDELLRDRKISYAGRLDPMAEGLLLLLVDDENKRRREYEKLDKTYEFEGLFGIETDSYDVLGIPELGNEKENLSSRKVQRFIMQNTGSLTQLPPPYSSVKVDGKPLYWWTRRKKQVALLPRTVKVEDFQLLNTSKIGKIGLEKFVLSKINNVRGDFRQEEIKESWKTLFKKINDEIEFSVLKFEITVSSGFYVRSVVWDMGRQMGGRALTLSIKRTRIGNHFLSDALSLKSP